MKKKFIFLILGILIFLLISSCYKKEYVNVQYDEKFITLNEKQKDKNLFIKNKNYDFNIKKYYIKRPIVEELIKVKVIQNNNVIKELLITKDNTNITIPMNNDTNILTIFEDKSKSNGIIVSEDIYENLNYTFSINRPYNLIESIKIDKRRAMLDITTNASISIKFDYIEANEYPNYSILYVNGKPVSEFEEHLTIELKTNSRYTNDTSLTIIFTIDEEFLRDNKEHIYVSFRANE